MICLLQSTPKHVWVGAWTEQVQKVRIATPELGYFVMKGVSMEKWMSNTIEMSKHHHDAACDVKWVIAESMHLLSYFFPFPQHAGWKCIIQLVYVKRQTGHESLWSSPSQSIQLRLKKQSLHSQICPRFGADYYRVSLSIKGDKDINILCKVLCVLLIGSTCLYILYKNIYICIYLAFLNTFKN